MRRSTPFATAGAAGFDSAGLADAAGAGVAAGVQAVKAAPLPAIAATCKNLRRDNFLLGMDIFFLLEMGVLRLLRIQKPINFYEYILI